MNNNINNNKIGNNLNKKTEGDLEIIKCELYTVLGDHSNNKQIYANGVMDIKIELIVTFNRELNEIEELYYNYGNFAQIGYWDQKTSQFIPAGGGLTNDEQIYSFMDTPGFYLGLYDNADKNKDMFHQYTIEEHTFMKNERSDILEIIKKNNHNYYEAYGNKLKSNQGSMRFSLRAGVGTLSNTISFKITLTDGTEYLTYTTDSLSFVALNLECKSQPSVAALDSGIQVLNDGLRIPIEYYADAINNYTVGSSVSIVAINRLVYAGTTEYLVPFAIYTPNIDLFNSYAVASRFEPLMGLHLETASSDALERRPATLQNAFLYHAQGTGGLEERHMSGKKSFAAYNPYQIVHKNGRWGLGGEAGAVTVVYINQKNIYTADVFGQDHSISSYDIPSINPQTPYTANLIVTWIGTRDEEVQRSAYYLDPETYEYPLFYNPDSVLNFGVRIPMIVMDRYGNRHLLTLRDVVSYAGPAYEIPISVTGGLSIE